MPSFDSRHLIRVKDISTGSTLHRHGHEFTARRFPALSASSACRVSGIGAVHLMRQALRHACFARPHAAAPFSRHSSPLLAADFAADEAHFDKPHMRYARGAISQRLAASAAMMSAGCHGRLFMPDA